VLLAALLADAFNLGLEKMAEACEVPGEVGPLINLTARWPRSPGTDPLAYSAAITSISHGR
jgi:hypothetical protein